MKTLKILSVILILAAISAFPALAHEGHEHAAGKGLFGFPPEYIHVLLNPIPGYGMVMGIFALGTALVVRNRTAQTIGLCIVIVSSAAVWPTMHFGTNAYKNIRGAADDAGQDALDEHMDRAQKAAVIFYATALLGIGALTTRRKFPKAATPLASVTLVFGLACLGAAGWIAKAGGQIRHPEFRAMSSASTKDSKESHGKMANMEKSEGHKHDEMASGESHEKMQHTEASSEHKHGDTASTPHDEKAPLPDTIEGVWKAIHEHHAELKTNVEAKQFKEVQSHVAMMNGLTKQLVAVSHPDHKPAVESGVKKITQALAEVKSSAETGSETVMQTSFKAFEEALNELEQQMKKH